MSKLKKSYLIIFVFFFISICLILTIIPIKSALVFQFENSGKVLAYLPITKEDTFKIKYTHSIHLSDVVESYTVTDDLLMKQYELMYEDFAIGMPSNASNGELFEQVNGKYFLKNMNNIHPFFDLRIGKIRANHRLINKEVEYPLTHYMEPGTWVRIQVKKISLWQQWKGANILE